MSLRVYEVRDNIQQKWYFFENTSTNNVRVFSSFVVSCDNGHNVVSITIRAIDFTSPGQYRKYPLNRNLIFKCSICGREDPNRVRVELI